MEEENLEQMEQMIKMIQMMKMMQEDSHYDEEPQNASSFLNDKIETTEIKMMQSALPFLRHEHQRSFALFVKMMEIRNLLHYYHTQDIHTNAFESREDWQRGMLLAMRPHLSEDKQSNLDMILKFIQMRNIMNMMNQGGMENEH